MSEIIIISTNEINNLVAVIHGFETKFDIELEDHVGDLNGLTGFAEACHDTNSTDELISALADGEDENDCKAWGISGEEWIDSIKSALSQQLYDLKSLFVELGLMYVGIPAVVFIGIRKKF